MATPVPRGARHLSRQPTRYESQGRRRKRSARKAVLVAACFLLVIGTAGFGYAWYLNGKIKRVNVQGLRTGATSGPHMNEENILLVGSTSRCALDNKQTQAFGSCAEGVTGVNSDVIMILHLNPNNKTITLLSIPRDLFVPNARSDGAGKVDAALAEGPTQLTAVVQQDLGISIQHYMELNFDSFQNVVNALGGINMYFPMPLHDAFSALNITSTGCQHLDGFQALAVVRARHLLYKPPTMTSNWYGDWPQDPESDLSRIRRDHEFLKVLASAVSHQGLSNPLTDQALISSVSGQLEVDSGLGIGDLVNLVLTYHGVSPYSMNSQTLPVLVDNSLTYYYKGYDYGNVEFPSYVDDRQVIDSFLGITPSTDSLTGQPLPNPSSVSVSVENGTGVYNQAEETASKLTALGYNVVGTGSAVPVGSEAETYIHYNPADPASEAAAESVAQTLSGAVILDNAPVSDGAQVTVVTGTDFAVTGPPPANAATTTSSSSTTTSTSPSGSGASSTTTSTTAATGPVQAGFAAVTSSQEPLAPFDPRSCTASGGEGP